MAERIARTHHQAEALAAQLPPLMVAAERVANTVSQGVHGRRRVGQGETFWQFRRYEFGDAVQRIDWRQSAKNDPVFIRETEWEAAQSVWLWRDGSESMQFVSETGLVSKKERGELLMMALASLLIRGGEHVAFLDGVAPPANGRAVLARLWSDVEGGRLGTAGLPKFRMLPRHGRLVLIGDFLSPIEEIRLAINAYAHHGVRGHVLRILDPAEEEFPFAGRVLFEGPEGEGSTVIGNVETIAGEYKRILAAHLAAVADVVKGAGWGMTQHRTDQAPETALMALYMALSDGGRR